MRGAHAPAQLLLLLLLLPLPLLLRAAPAPQPPQPSSTPTAAAGEAFASAASAEAPAPGSAGEEEEGEEGGCPAACECERDARLWAWLPREESLSAQCARRRLQSLPRGDPALRHLDASGNQLDALGAGARGLAALGWHGLRTLDLSDNALARVEGGALRGLAQLQRVLLARNRLAALPPDLFAPCPELWFLSLAGNPLAVPDAASGRALLVAAPALRVLDLSACKLSEFPDHALGEGSALQELLVANNSIAEVRVRRLARLRRLDVGDNRVRALSVEALSAAPDLRSLVLDGNPLDGEGPLLVAGGGGAGVGLRALSASRCGLRRLDAAAVAALPLLEELALDDNALPELPPEALAALPRLRRLSLRRNRLRAPPALRHARLRALDLSGNALQQLGASPADAEAETWAVDAPALRLLRLAHCGLRALPAEALRGGAPQLRDLSLAHNALRWLDAALVAALPRLRALDLRGNPLRCDAALRPLWVAAEARRVRVDATCLEPPGDWALLRFALGDFNATSTTVTSASTGAATAPGDDEDHERLQQQDDDEDDDDDLAEELVKYGVRWGPVLGGFLLVVASVLVLRKWLDYMNAKRFRYPSSAKSKEFVYESDEDEDTTTTMMTDAGGPVASPPPVPASAAAAAAVASPPRTRFAVAPVTLGES